MQQEYIGYFVNLLDSIMEFLDSQSCPVRRQDTVISAFRLRDCHALCKLKTLCILVKRVGALLSIQKTKVYVSTQFSMLFQWQPSCRITSSFLYSCFDIVDFVFVLNMCRCILSNKQSSSSERQRVQTLILYCLKPMLILSCYCFYGQQRFHFFLLTKPETFVCFYRRLFIVVPCRTDLSSYILKISHVLNVFVGVMFLNNVDHGQTSILRDLSSPFLYRL